MRNIIATSFSALLIFGCAIEGKPIDETVPNSCGGTGHSFVIIHYGDSRLFALPIVKIQAGKELQYRLLPDRRKSDLVNYEESLVTITGKSAYPLDWMNASGRFTSSSGVFKVCVPADAPLDFEYSYKIKVDGLGELDPRARVVP